MATIDGDVYVFGGSIPFGYDDMGSSADRRDSKFHNRKTSASVERYDRERDKWVMCQEMTHCRSSFPFWVVN